MKRIFGSMGRSVKNTNYQDRAVKYAEKIDSGKVKVNAPKYPTEQKYFEKTAHDADLKQKIDEKDAGLIDNMNKFAIHSTEPVERWTSTKELPTRESEYLHRNDPAWEYGFYEPSPEKIEKNRLTFREALEIMRAKLEIDGSKEFAREEVDKAHDVLEHHQAVRRVDPERLDRMWHYFRPFERRDTQKVVSKHKVDQLREALHGKSDERRLMDGFKENFRKAVGSTTSDESRRFEKLTDSEKEQFLLAVKEQRQLEHERLEKRLAEIQKDELEMERGAGNQNEEVAELEVKIKK
uniref:39S ribosomal protein L59, mitochondrial n=1 Tax=Steinernema glaseri TaxID=37863 RepID=A0A1I8AG65_9BILA